MFSTFSEIDRKRKTEFCTPKLCLFCYKNVNPEHLGNLHNDKQRFDLFTKFIRNVQMFTEVDNTLVKFLSESSFQDYLRCCQNCTTIASQFCKDYYQFKCLELQLHWKLETLVNVVEFANTIPERVSRLRAIVCHNVVQEQEKTRRVQSVKLFRQQLVQNCKQKLLKCGPRVFIKRVPNVNSALALPVTSTRSAQVADDVATATKEENGCDQYHVHSNSYSGFREDEPLMEVNLDVKSEGCEIDHENWAEEIVHENENDDGLQEPVCSRNAIEMDNFGSISIPLEVQPASSPPSSVHSFMDADMETMSNPNTPINSQENPEQEVIQAPTANHKIPAIGLPEKSEISIPRPRTILGGPCSPKTFKCQSAFIRHVKHQHPNKSPKAKKSYHCQPCKMTFGSYTQFKLHKLTKKHKLLRKALVKWKQKVNDKQEDGQSLPVAADNKAIFEGAGVHEESQTKTNANHPAISINLDLPRDQERHYSLRTRRARIAVKKENNDSDNDTTDSSSDDYVSDPNSDTEDIKVAISIQKNLTCSVFECNKRFRTPEMLQSHQNLHGQFTCTLCPVTKDYAPDLAKHEFSHSGQTSDKIFYCTRCTRSYKQEPLLVTHFCEQHLNVSRKAKCSICNAAMDNRKFTIDKHMNAFHKTKGLKPEEIYNCNECPAYFVTSRQLRHHLVTYHWKEKCPVCEFVTKAKDSVGKITAHIERNHPHRFSFLKFKCDDPKCIAMFATEKELTEHMKVHVKLQCSKCEKSFTHITQLKYHEQGFHGARVFLCTLCGKGFRTNAKLKLHMVYHEDPKNWEFGCTTCSKRFVAKQKLDEHQRTHTKEKPFVCHCCGEKYAHRHNWRNHMKTRHPNEFEETSIKRGDNLEYFSRKGSKKGECLLTAGVHIK